MGRGVSPMSSDRTHRDARCSMAFRRVRLGEAHLPSVHVSPPVPGNPGRVRARPGWRVRRRRIRRRVPRRCRGRRCRWAKTLSHRGRARAGAPGIVSAYRAADGPGRRAANRSYSFAGDTGPRCRVVKPAGISKKQGGFDFIEVALFLSPHGRRLCVPRFRRVRNRVTSSYWLTAHFSG